jgi:YD repeat-containing protein
MMQAAFPSTLPNDPTVYTYYAFVSYSHKDEKWGKWIQNALERYRLPAAVRKEVGKPLPQKIHPVFRDDTDLGACRLEAGLQQELEQSRFLIVVCSPNSARPNAEGKHWVNEEVKRFCDMGRADRVIPVIVDGTAETAFCPKIAEEGLLGLDATKHSKPRILNDLVAKILGLRPDELWRREERRLRAKRRWQIFAASAATLFIALGSYSWWDCTRTVRNYYADYVDSFGLPKGIFQLKKSELKGRHLHYRFEYQGFQFEESPHADSADWCILNLFGLRRRLVRVVQANSRGFPCIWDHTEYVERPQIQDFTYDKARLREIHYGRFNGKGKEPYLEKRIELSNESGVTNGLLQFYSREGRLGKAFMISSPTMAVDKASAKSEIAQHLVQRDRNGRVTQLLFLNLSDANVADGDGIYGFSYEYDDRGRQTAQWYLFRNGDGFERRVNKTGVAGKRYEYSGRNMCRTEYVDTEGRPATGPHGWKACVDSFDSSDNNTESWFFDDKGNKTLCSNGYAGCLTQYDEQGNMIRLLYVGVDGEPTLHKDGTASVRWEYDERGNMVSASYFGADGLPTLHKDGFAKVRWEYDERGNMVSASYFGADGLPTLHKDGFAKVRGEYDGRGNVVSASYFGADGLPTLHKDGFAEVRGEYDGRGNKLKESYFGADGEPMVSKNGFAEARWEYDGRGNATKESYFGVDSEPMLSKDGFAEVRMLYNEHGNMVSASYFGADGLPTLHKNGYAEVRWEYDGRGNATKESYFGVDSEPTLGKDGFAEARMLYDGRGNKCKEFYFGVDGAPMLSKDGFAEMRMEYDERGNKTMQSYFDTDGQPTLNNDGIAEMRWEYDGRGNTLNESFFGVDGRLTQLKDGISRTCWEYDERGNKIKMVFFGEDGHPTSDKDGISKICWEYDERGNTTRISCFDVTGQQTMHHKGFADVCVEYDERGNKIRQSHFGVDGRPTPDQDGIAEARWEYDGRGNATKESYFGVDSEPMLSKDGFAEARMLYDEHGNMVSASYFGADCLPTLHKNGYAEVRWEYDGRGNTIKESYFGVDSEPMLSKDGFAEARWEYDERGNKIRQSHFSVDGRPILDQDGIAETRWEYDGRGNATKESYFGVDSEPMLGKNGFAEARMLYDGRGNKTSQAYFGANGVPMLSKDGFAEVRWKYDGQRNMTMQSFFGVDGRPTLNKDGIAEMCWEYDGRGNKIKESYLDTDNVPTTDNNGISWSDSEFDSEDHLLQRDFYALAGEGGIWGATNVHHVVQRFDANGNQTHESYFDTDNVPTTDNNGISWFDSAFDSEGHLVQRDFYALAGEGGLGGATNVHHVVQRFDANGNQTHESYFDTDNVPTTDNNGLSWFDSAFDSEGHLVQRDFYALPGEGGIWGNTNVHHAVRRFDANGNQTHESYFDTDNVPTTDNNGLSWFDSAFDSEGHLVQRDFYALAGEGGLGGDTNVHHAVRRFDANGNQTHESYFDTDNVPTTDNNGLSWFDSAFDSAGHLVQRDFYALAGEGGLGGDTNVHHTVRRFDASGNITHESYFDTDNVPTTDNNGIAWLTIEFDSGGHETQSDFHALEGQGGIWGNTNVHHAVRCFDNNGNKTHESYFDTNNIPTRNNSGITLILNIYDHGTLVQKEFFAPDGEDGIFNDNSVHRLACLCDERGNTIKAASFDTQGRLLQSGETRVLAVSIEIVEQSRAEEQGVAEGDIWCRFGSYDILESEKVEDVAHAIAEFSNAEKELVVARKTPDGYTIHAFHFPPGPMGIRVMDKPIWDAGRLLDAYRNYLEKDNAPK